MRTRLILVAALALVPVAAPSGAAAADYVPGSLIVKYRQGTAPRVQSQVERIAGVETERALPGGSAEAQIEDGDSVRRTLAELRADPNVAYAVPNYIAHA